MAGLDAFGTQFACGDGGSPEIFTPVANCTNVGGPETERATHDVTAHDSPDKWREFIGGLKDGGEVSLELHYDPRDHDALYEHYEDDQPRNYRILWPEGLGGWQIKGVMTGFSSEAPFDDKLSAEVTFKVSGKPVLLV